MPPLTHAGERALRVLLGRRDGPHVGPQRNKAGSPLGRGPCARLVERRVLHHLRLQGNQAPGVRGAFNRGGWSLVHPVPRSAFPVESKTALLAVIALSSNKRGSSLLLQCNKLHWVQHMSWPALLQTRRLCDVVMPFMSKRPGEAFPGLPACRSAPAEIVQMAWELSRSSTDGVGTPSQAWTGYWQPL